MQTASPQVASQATNEQVQTPNLKKEYQKRLQETFGTKRPSSGQISKVKAFTGTSDLLKKEIKMHLDRRNEIVKEKASFKKLNLNQEKREP